MEPVLVKPVSVRAMATTRSATRVVTTREVQEKERGAALLGLDEHYGRTASRCGDCGSMCATSHRGACEDIARAAGVSGATLKDLQQGKRAEVVRTGGQRGKRLRQEVAKIDVLACALDKRLSTLQTARLLSSLGRAMHKKAKQELLDEIKNLDAGGSASE